MHISDPARMGVVAVLLAGAASFPTHATTPEIRGTWEGTVTVDEFCPPPAGNELGDVSPVRLEFDQSGSSFTGKAIADSGDPDEFSLTISGTIDATGSFTASISGTNKGGGFESYSNVSGSVSGDTLTISGSGSESGGANCTLISFSGTLARTSGGTVNPATATGQAVVNNATTLTEVARTFSTTLQSRIGAILRGRAADFRVDASGRLYAGSGMAAGEGSTPKGVWISYNYTEFENDFSRTRFDGARHMGLAGVDVAPTPHTVLGVGVGYEDASIDTAFNIGSVDQTGITVLGYAGALLSETWAADVSAGYSLLETEMVRTAPGTRITGDTDTDRWFLSANASGQWLHDDWRLTARTGLLHARTKDDAFVESNATAVGSRRSRVTQFSIGGELARAFGAWEPFAGGTYNRDISATDVILSAGAQPSNDRDDFVLTGGVRYFGDGALSGQADFNTRIGRDDFSQWGVNLMARWEF